MAGTLSALSCFMDAKYITAGSAVIVAAVALYFFVQHQQAQAQIARDASAGCAAYRWAGSIAYDAYKISGIDSPRYKKLAAEARSLQAEYGCSD